MEIKITITIDDGEIKDVKVDKSENAIDLSGPAASEYARYFDESSPNWNKDPEMNLFFLKRCQMHMNDLLKNRGYLFLNEVYDQLGLPKTRAGQIVGWVYDENNPIGDNYVDFGIFKTDNVKSVNGYENAILLDFNVDGSIMDILP